MVDDVLSRAIEALLAAGWRGVLAAVALALVAAFLGYAWVHRPPPTEPPAPPPMPDVADVPGRPSAGWGENVNPDPSSPPGGDMRGG